MIWKFLFFSCRCSMKQNKDGMVHQSHWDQTKIQLSKKFIQKKREEKNTIYLLDIHSIKGNKSKINFESNSTTTQSHSMDSSYTNLSTTSKIKDILFYRLCLSSFVFRLFQRRKNNIVSMREFSLPYRK